MDDHVLPIKHIHYWQNMIIPMYNNIYFKSQFHIKNFGKQILKHKIKGMYLKNDVNCQLLTWKRSMESSTKTTPPGSLDETFSNHRGNSSSRRTGLHVKAGGEVTCCISCRKKNEQIRLKISLHYTLTLSLVSMGRLWPYWSTINTKLNFVKVG